ncbi:MAG: hypothetical protein IVW55_06335 [Chloroflexi bacterium]|nr:hypothetical protein [Chloroflexota bacterium]
MVGLCVTVLGLQVAVSFNLPAMGRAEGLIWPGEWQADSAFYNLWSRADGPVATGLAARSWLWGPLPYAVVDEPYNESPTGRRLVEYLDKARMEVNDPSADRTSPWFVTSGLLVREMVTGQIQTGNSRFDARSPATLLVAGDPTSPDAPTYAAFATHLGAGPSPPDGQPAQGTVKERINKDGAVTTLAKSDVPTDTALFSMAAFDPVSRHNIPVVFDTWMRQRSTMLDGGQLVQAPLMDPLYLLGRPITEPYWADVLVGGKPARVLIQLYERRALTYNPLNAPEWRVEMANVGRAYYNWRYKDSPVEPAIAAEVMQSGLTVHGWNWPASAAVQLSVDLAGDATPLLGPQSATPDTVGSFAASIPINAQMQSALASGANVRITAQGQSYSVALPLAYKAAAGKVQITGVLTQLPARPASSEQLLMRDQSGVEWSLALSNNTLITYSEGASAPASVLQVGISVSVEGAALGAVVDVSTLRLLSVSRTSARLGYEWQPNNKALRVSGTGWPAEKPVTFSIGPANGNTPASGTAAADSRGNIYAVVQMPPSLPAAQAMWLAAASSDQGVLLAQITVPVGPTPAPPPQLALLTRSGEQLGGVGSYCWLSRCRDTIGIPLPGMALSATAGEVLGLRSIYGADPQAGLTPLTFSAVLYPYPDSAQSTVVGGQLYFPPASQPAHATGDLPGRPFSIALPQGLQSGRYVLAVSVGWPGASGSKESAQYGFTLQVP